MENDALIGAKSLFLAPNETKGHYVAPNGTWRKAISERTRSYSLLLLSACAFNAFCWVLLSSNSARWCVCTKRDNKMKNDFKKYMNYYLTLDEFLDLCFLLFKRPSCLLGALDLQVVGEESQSGPS